jgi:multiple sugar transport system permease protein
VAVVARARGGSLRRRQAIEGYLCILPWLVGFVCFTIGPMVAALGLAFMNWDVLTAATFTGLSNFQRILNNPLFYTSVYNTLYLSFISVPLHLLLALLLALALNQKLRGMPAYRTAFYLPSQTPLVATALLWVWIYNPDFGLLNAGLGWLGIPPQKWLFDVTLSKPSIVLISLWAGTGTQMIIFLAGLQGVPESLYEAAAIDGAGTWARFRNVTIPMISPVIFFNLIIGIIASFQGFFTLIYVTTRGGPVNSTLTLIIHIYLKAFEDFAFGYASALAMILFLMVLAMTGIQFALARRWVHYEAGTNS